MFFFKNMIFSKFCHGIFLPHVVLGTLHAPEHGTKGRQNGYFGFSYGDYRIYVENCQLSLKVLNRFLCYERFPLWIHFLDFHWLAIVYTKYCKLLNEVHVTGKVFWLLPKVLTSSASPLHHLSLFQLLCVALEWGQTWQAFHQKVQ